MAETANLPIGEETGTPSEISLLSATNPVLEAKVNEFTTAVDAFDDALKASATNPATATATATDDARDASWRVEKPRDFDPFGQAGLSPLATI